MCFFRSPFWFLFVFVCRGAQIGVPEDVSEFNGHPLIYNIYEERKAWGSKARALLLCFVSVLFFVFRFRKTFLLWRTTHFANPRHHLTTLPPPPTKNNGNSNDSHHQSPTTTTTTTTTTTATTNHRRRRQHRRRRRRRRHCFVGMICRFASTFRTWAASTKSSSVAPTTPRSSSRSRR